MEFMTCGHRNMRDMKLEYPYIYGTFADGKRLRLDIIKTYVPRRPEYQALVEPDFFNKAYLDHQHVVRWNDDIDMLCDWIYEEGEIV